MEEPIWTTQSVLQWTSKRFLEHGLSTPLLDAQLLICEALRCSKVELYSHWDRPLSPSERNALRDLVRRRLKGEPIAYLLSRKCWHDLDLFVDKRVLIPRPETETLLDFVLQIWQSSEEKPRTILDLCTGSGCLAIALARAFPAAEVLAVDIDSEALSVAKENCIQHQVERVHLIQGDVCSPKFLANLKPPSEGFDIIVSNPPYVSKQEWGQCMPEVRDFEPIRALVAGETGLEVASSILEQLDRDPQILSTHAVYAMEVGVGHPNILGGRRTTPVREFAAHTPLWQLPHGSEFALRDLTDRSRFLCKLIGLTLLQARN